MGTQRLHQRSAQAGVTFGLDAEEGFEGRHRLMHQHAQPIDGLDGRAPRASFSRSVSSGL